MHFIKRKISFWLMETKLSVVLGGAHEGGKKKKYETMQQSCKLKGNLVRKTKKCV
jgi:hypothetical protein